MKRHRSEKRQIERDLAGEIVGDPVGAIVGMLGKLEQRKCHVGLDRDVEIRVAECAHAKRVIHRAARNWIAAHTQIRGQALDRQGPIIGIVYPQRDPKVLLQQIAADQTDVHDR